MNLKKLFAGLTAIAVVAGFALATPSANGQLINDPEFDAALDWAYNEGLTRYNTQADFNPYGTLTREQFAKFASVYGATNLCLPADMDASCTFSDVAQADYTLVSSVELACQMGLVKGYDGMYGYTDPVTKAEVLTVLSRAISAAAGETAPSETMTPWYRGHFEAMRALGITNETDAAAVNVEVSRYEVGLMLYRARVDDAVCGDDAVDIGDILGDLFDDADDDDTDTDTDTGTDADDDDDDLDVPTSSNGTVMASLSPTTPNGATVPGGVTVNAASFDFTADDDDVTLDSVLLQRYGLGGDDVIDEVTIAVDGDIVSKGRRFNTSDRTARLNLNPRVTVEAGETVTIDVIAKVGTVADAGGEQFQLGLVDFETNGTSDTSNLPERANMFEIGNVDGATVKVSDDGSINDVEVGDTQAEVASFEIESDNDDVYVTSIALDDDDNNADDYLENFVLEADGDVVATTARSNNDLVTFTLDEDFFIEEGRTVTFTVFADVTGGPAETIAFVIDNEIYVRGYDVNYGYGLAVDLTTPGYSAQQFAINAGELTLVEQELPASKIREDQDDIVLAEFDVNINAGQDLSLEDIKFVVEADNAGPFSGANDLLDHFENVELEVWVDGSRRTYDLSVNSTADNVFEAMDDDLAIFLPESGDITVRMVADTINNIPATSFNERFRASLDVSNDLLIIENSDDEEVTSIVPSGINFDRIEFVESSVELNGINLTNVDVVKGTQNVDAVMFEVDTDDVSDVYVDSFTFGGEVTSGSNNGNITAGISSFDRDLVNALRLWKQTSSGWELMEQQSGFDINSGEITFDSFDEDVVPASSQQVYLLTVDVADSDDVVGVEFDVSLTDAKIEDDDNNRLTDSPLSPSVDSNRTVSVEDTGDLDVFTVNDAPVDKNLHVVAGTEATVAAFEVIATNEGITLEDISLTASGDTANFATSVSEVVLYGDDMTTEIARRNVTSTSGVINFNNINIDVEEGSTMMYVAVNTRRTGNNFNGVILEDTQFTFDVLEAEGTQSGEEVVTLPTVMHPYVFDVIPVHISGLAITNAGDTVSELSAGTSIGLGVIEVTANTWNNTNPTNGSSIDAILEALAVEINTNASYNTGTVEFERIDLSSSNRTCTTTVAGNIATVDFTSCNTSVKEIAPGATAQFEVTVEFNGPLTSGDSARLRMNDLTSGAFLEYSAEGYGVASNVTDLRLGLSQVQGTQKTFNN